MNCRRLVIFLVVTFGVRPVEAWGPEGHRTVARVAAAHLSAKAQAGVKNLLASDPLAKDAPSVAEIMAAVAVWADDIKQQTGTGEWHFLDLASSDTKAQIAARCPSAGCVTRAIDNMRPNLKSSHNLRHGSSSFTAAEQLKFVIHFMGDLHQPLHCATNADAGGNCLRTAGFGTNELHAAWDTGMIRQVLLKNTQEPALAGAIDMSFAGQFAGIVKVSGVDDMAIESHQVAFQAAYGPLLAKLRAPEPRPFLRVSTGACATKAADFFHIQPRPNLASLYGSATFDTVRRQLAAGGYRLADLLNTVFH